MIKSVKQQDGEIIKEYVFNNPTSVMCLTDTMECKFEDLNENKVIERFSINQLTVSPSAGFRDDSIKREYYEEVYGDAHDMFLSKKNPNDEINFYIDMVAGTRCEESSGSMRCFVE